MLPSIKRSSAEGTANTNVTVSDPAADTPRRFLFATVKYTATVTETCTLTLNSGLGATFDTELDSVAVTATDGVIFAKHERVFVGKDDALDFLAPAGGAGISADVVIYMEQL